MFYGKYIKSNVIEPLDKGTFERLISSPELAGLDSEIAALNARLDKGEIDKADFEAMKIANKQKRPYICTSDFCKSEECGVRSEELNASTCNGRFVRSNKYAQWSGFASLDIDHLGDLVSSEKCVVRSEATPLALYETRIKGHEEEWGIVAVFISPSQRGLKIIFRIGKDAKIADAQRALAEKIGTEFDASTKDPSRCSFLVGKELFVYLDMEGLFTKTPEEFSLVCSEQCVVRSDELVSSEQCVVSSEPTAAKANEGEAPLHTTHCSLHTKEAPLHTTHCSLHTKEALPSYNGVPMSAIVKEWWGQHGVPSVGVRHASIYTLANNLRYICENDPRMTYEAIKTHDTFGKPDQEVMDICKDVCAKRGDYAYMPKMLQAVIDGLMNSEELGVWSEELNALENATSKSNNSSLHTPHSSLNDAPPSLPKKLPFLVKALISRAPKKLRPYLAMAIWPSLMVLPKNLKVVYSTNELRELAQLTLTMGPFASGKSAQNAIINAILKNVKERDKGNLARLKDWLDQCKSMGANKQKPPRPDNIVIQIANPDITGARFWEMQNDLKGATMYIRMNEMDQLRKLPNWSSTMRAAFDREESGQDRVGPMSVNAHVDAMRLNVNMSATIGNARNILRNDLRNGTLSRLTLCCTATDDENFDDDGEYKFGQYDAQYFADIAAPLANLEAATGTIDCCQARKLATKMLGECNERAILSGCATYKDLAKRAVEQAFYRAVTLYIAQGMRWTRETEAFVRWSLEYDLWCKMYFFGDLFDNLSTESAITHRGRKNLLESMPCEFSRHEFYKMMPQGRTRRANDKLLCTWKNRNYVEERDGMFVKTGKR